MNACCTGPFPAFVEDADDEDDEPYTNSEVPTDAESDGPDDFDFPDEPLEEGNRIWATGLFPQAEHIRATATISQRLVEGFRQNTEPAGDERVPPYITTIFSKYRTNQTTALTTQPFVRHLLYTLYLGQCPVDSLKSYSAFFL